MLVEIILEETISVGNEDSLLLVYKHLEDLLQKNRYICREEYITIIEEDKTK